MKRVENETSHRNRMEWKMKRSGNEPSYQNETKWKMKLLIKGERNENPNYLSTFNISKIIF